MALPNLPLPNMPRPNIQIPNLPTLPDLHNLPHLPSLSDLRNLSNLSHLPDLAAMHRPARDLGVADFDTGDLFNTAPQRTGADKVNGVSVGKQNWELALQDRQSFILTLAKALIFYGSPSHHSLVYLQTASDILRCPTSFVLLPGLTIVSFGLQNTKSRRLSLIRSSTRTSLTCLDQLHRYYEQVISGATDIHQGRKLVNDLIKERPRYRPLYCVICAALCAATICSTAYSGSMADMFISGLFGGLLQYIQILASNHNSVVYGDVVKLFAAILISFFCKALSSITLSSRRELLFCYTAISAASITSLIPGFVVLTAALEIGWSTAMISGTLRMVYAMMFTAFLGFGLNLGSSWWMLIWTPTPHESMVLSNNTTVHGSFTAYNSSHFIPNGVTLTITTLVSNSSPLTGGCYRPLDPPFYLRPLPRWSLAFLVPTYSMFSSLKNMQSVKSWRRLLSMIVIACVAYALNVSTHFWVIGTDTTVSTFCGAFFIGMAANIWTWAGRNRAIRRGSFTLMVTGLDFLVPSGLGQSGVFAQTGLNGTLAEYIPSIDIVLGVIKIATGVTLGLFTSNMLAIIISWTFALIAGKDRRKIPEPGL